MAIEINLLPWRAYAKAKRFKLKLYLGIAGLMLCCLAAGIFYYTTETSEPEKPVTPEPVSDEIPKPAGMEIINQAQLDHGKMTVDLQNVPLPEALNLFARFTHFNLVMSPDITGSVTLHLKRVNVNAAFDMLLMSQGLSQWSKGNLLFVAPHSEMMRRKQEALRFQEAATEMAPLLTRTWQIRYAKAQDIAHLLKEGGHTLLSKRGVINVDERTNRIYVRDVEKSFLSVTQLVREFDVPVRQVLIEARLASVDSDCERELGVNFSVQNPVISRSLPNFSDGPHAIPRYSIAVASLPNGSQLDVALSALEEEGKGELISSPHLFTANQQTASIEAGEEIPYQETSASGATSVAFKKAVLSLKVTPQILPDNQVMLQLAINQDRPSNRIVLGVPAISTRQMLTNILIHNGETVVLGGIYELNKEKGEERIPFLGKIPVVGLLFTMSHVRENKRELLIFVTPRIISPG